MRHTSSFIILTATFFLCLYSCKKQDNEILVPPTNINGTLLIWSGSPAAFGACGPTLLVELSNGMQSTITNYYTAAPSTCSKQFGGYFSLAPGNYTFTVTTIGPCTPYTATARVDTGSCAIIKLP